LSKTKFKTKFIVKHTILAVSFLRKHVNKSNRRLQI